MAPTSQSKKQVEKQGRRGVYCLAMGLGAFFAYFNSAHKWVATPSYDNPKDIWLKPFMPVLEPFLPHITIAVGVGLLAYAVFCLWQYWSLTKRGG